MSLYVGFHDILWLFLTPTMFLLPMLRFAVKKLDFSIAKFEVRVYNTH